MVVEIPAGSRNKYEMDHEHGYLRLDRTLFTATVYPADYGFITGTTGEDGDPLDALVLLESSTFPGCRVAVRPIGVFWMQDESGPDAKLLCVPVDDPRWSDTVGIDDLPRHLLDEISHFFDVYKDLEPDKNTDVRGWEDSESAESVLASAQERYRAQKRPQAQDGSGPPRET
jgi:inorganic pyrophosphatase